MRGVIHAIEPLVWGLFVTGNFLSALLLPGVLVMVAIVVPLGLIPPEALAYERAHALAANPFGRIVILALVVSCLWNGAHHLRHFLIDMGGAARDTAAATCLYALGVAGSLGAIAAVLRF